MEHAQKDQPLIEVELRGLLTPEAYDALQQRLLDEGVSSEADDKETYFFRFPPGILKVCDEISKDRGKISLKIGEEAQGALQEREVLLPHDQVDATLDLFRAIGYGEPHQVTQKRTNYFLPTSTLSLKFTEDFRYHFELEGEPVFDPLLVEEEKLHLRQVCAEYGLVPLEPAEVEKRIKAIKERIGFSAPQDGATT